MKRKKEEVKSKRGEKKLETEKPKKEFKIKIEKVGKLEENTAGLDQVCYQCEL
jgi:hypothetical protein